MTDQLTVFAALSAVMEEVQAIGKTERNTQQNYNFRGIDAVVNAVGPALRKHGVIVVPIETRNDVEHYETSKGTPMRDVTLTVTFRFYGPNGDHFDAQVCGESADAGDKAVPKAHSVAYRTLLLQALCIPTDDPDPDSQSHERGSMPQQQNGATEDKPSVKAKRLAHLEDTIAALNLATGRDDWRAKFEVTAEANFGKKTFGELTVKQLDPLITDAEHQLAHATVETPIS